MKKPLKNNVIPKTTRLGGVHFGAITRFFEWCRGVRFSLPAGEIVVILKSWSDSDGKLYLRGCSLVKRSPFGSGQERSYWWIDFPPEVIRPLNREEIEHIINSAPVLPDEVLDSSVREVLSQISRLESAGQV